MSHWHSAAIRADEIWLDDASSDPSNWGVHRGQYPTSVQAMSIESVCANIYGSTREICLLGGYEGNPLAVVVQSLESLSKDDDANHAYIVAPVMCEGDRCEYHWS
jgi:hypothetical protein